MSDQDKKPFDLAKTFESLSENPAVKRAVEAISPAAKAAAGIVSDVQHRLGEMVPPARRWATEDELAKALALVTSALALALEQRGIMPRAEFADVLDEQAKAFEGTEGYGGAIELVKGAARTLRGESAVPAANAPESLSPGE